MVNNKPNVRLGITEGLLKLILDKVDKEFTAKSQSYLKKLYKAVISLGWHGLLRVGELTLGNNPIKIQNVFCGENKRTVQIV